MCGTVGPGRDAPCRREPGFWPGDPYPRTWRQKVARVALWRTGGVSLSNDPAGRPHSGVGDRGPPAGRPEAGVSAGSPGRVDEADNWRPIRRHHIAPLALRSRLAPSVEGARAPWNGREECIARGSSRGCSKRARACVGNGDPGPRHDRFLGTRVGEASNPGPVPLDPWDLDPAFSSLFAIFGEGWVVFVFQGLHDRGGSPTLSFRAVAPLGGRAATFRVLGEDHFFSGLIAGQAYVCAEARPVLPHWEGAHEFTSVTPDFERPSSEYAWPLRDLPGQRATLSGKVGRGHTPTWRVG